MVRKIWYVQFSIMGVKWRQGIIFGVCKQNNKLSNNMPFPAIARHTDLKPFLTTKVCLSTYFLKFALWLWNLQINACFVIKGKFLTQQTRKTGEGHALLNQVRRAESFADLVSQLDATIVCYKTQKKKKETKLLNFLSLKCRRMKCLEAQGCK